MTICKFSRLFAIPISILCWANVTFAQLPAADTIKTAKGNIIIQPVFHGALVIQFGPTVVYVDPYHSVDAYKRLKSPDLILITDIHQDHLDTNTLKTLNLDKTHFIIPKSVAESLPQKKKGQYNILNNGSAILWGDITISAIPMYNLPEEPNSRHTRGRGNGYIMEYAGKRLYVSGDTEDIPEMRALNNVDVAFICMNQPFTMTVDQAASAVLDFKPRIVYPYHYRDMDGFSDIKVFARLVSAKNSGIEIRLRNWYTDNAALEKVTKSGNIVYGMVSGAALTMDVYKPDHSNRRALIVIPGSAFGYAFTDDYDQLSLTEIFSKDTSYFGKYVRLLIKKGYTLFVINHRLAPAFHYKEIFGDCQRAAQVIRYKAKEFDIDPSHIGAIGYSSGATLCSMLGVTDRVKKRGSTGMDTVSSKVQAVVTLAGRFDLADFNAKEDTAIQIQVVSDVLSRYIGEAPGKANGTLIGSEKYVEASPISYVDKGDASFLIYGSYNDPLVPHRQPANMYKKLIELGVSAKLKLSHQGGHRPVPDIEEIHNWFETELSVTKRQ